MNQLSFLAARGNLIHVTIAGQGDPLMLLHGFPLDHRQWLPQLELLSAHHRVIAPDLRGFGRSTLNESGYTIADLADDVEQVRLRLAPDGPLALCGLSMGGYVALEYWRSHASRLSSLILTNTKPDADNAPARAARQAMIERAQQYGSWQAVAPMLPKLLAQAHIEARSELFKSVEQMLHDCSADAIVAAQQAMSGRSDFISSLPALRVPTLVIGGEQDSIAPPEATRKWAAVIPDSQCHIICDSAHLCPLEAPDEFCSLVNEFLKS